MEKILKQRINLFEKETIRKELREVRFDTTMQEKNITFPTDRKLFEKVITYCKQMANHRMLRNYLVGTARGVINTLLAATASNMLKWIRMQRKDFFIFISGHFPRPCYSPG